MERALGGTLTISWTSFWGCQQHWAHQLFGICAVEYVKPRCNIATHWHVISIAYMTLNWVIWNWNFKHHGSSATLDAHSNISAFEFSIWAAIYLFYLRVAKYTYLVIRCNDIRKYGLSWLCSCRCCKVLYEVEENTHRHKAKYFTRGGGWRHRVFSLQFTPC